MLIHADRVFELLEDFRICWITGRLRGGKTSLAFRLSVPFLEKGYKLISNCKNVWEDDYIELREDKTYKSIVIADEGGRYMRVGVVIDDFMKMAGKIDVINIISSFQEPHRDAQIFTIEVQKGLSPVGIPVRFYTYKVRHKMVKEQGWFAWMLPNEVQGIYSTNDPITGIQKISDFMERTVVEYTKSQGYTDNEISRMEKTWRLDDISELVQDAVSEIGNLSDRLGDTPIFNGAGRKK